MSARSRIVETVSIVVGLVALLYGAGQVLSQPDLNKDVTYRTYDEMVADGAIERGWMPPTAPKSMRDVRESHNLDTNRSWMTFRFDPADADAFVAGATALTREKVVFPAFDRKRSWWPSALTAGSASSTDALQFYVLPEPRGGAAYIAIDPKAGEAWVWRLSS